MRIAMIAAATVTGGTALGAGGGKSTVWTIRNGADAPVVVACGLEPDESHVSIKMTTEAIAAGAELKYGWSEDLYNDGLGLNAGRWTCTARAATDGALAGESGRFTTDWGEAATLVVEGEGGRFRVVKRASAVSVGPKAGAGGVAK